MTSDRDLVHRNKYKFLVVSALSAFMGTLDGSIVNVSLPTLTRDFNVSIDVIAWIVLAYSLAISATLLLVGRLAARRGFRFTYMMGFGLFTLGSFFCGMSELFWQLIAARVIQGIGSSFLMAAGPALITRAFPDNERGKGMGILGTVVGVGLMSGPPLGGFIVSTFGWEWIFFLNLPVGIFGYLYAAKLLKSLSPDSPDSRLDLSGGVFQAVAVVFILLYLNRINNTDWPQMFLYSVLAVGLIALILFIRRELTTEHPLVGLDIFKFREFRLAISAMLVSFTCTAAGMVLIPFYLEEILNLDPTHVGLVLVTIPICTIIFAPIAGRVSDKIGYRLLTTAGLAIMSVGIFWVATLNQFSSRFDVVIRMVVLGIGGGLFQAPNSSALMASVPRKMTPIASSLLAVARTLGLGVGVAIATALFAYRKDIQLTLLNHDEAFVAAFQWVVVAFAIFSLLAPLISVFRKNRSPEHGEA